MTLLITLLLAATMSPAETQRLEPCPETPNCVSTQAERPSQRMDPIPFNGDAQAALERLLEILADQPRVEIRDSGTQLIRAVFTTRLMRFKDDVVFLIDPRQRLIHFRSASRVGRSDLGANRTRMERLSELFLKAEAQSR